MNFRLVCLVLDKFIKYDNRKTIIGVIYTSYLNYTLQTDTVLLVNYKNTVLGSVLVTNIVIKIFCILKEFL